MIEPAAARHAFAALLLATLWTDPAAAQAETGDTADFRAGWYLQGGAYIHYDEEDDYEGPPLFAGIEYFRSREWLLGFSMFQNSFGQFSQYAYIGRVFRPWDSRPNLHIKITGGIVQGYRDPNHDTLPIRWGESWGIGAIPTIGYKKGRTGFDLAFLKESGLLFLAGYHFE